MFLSPFFDTTDGFVTISAEKASNFAKSIANDFNPIHDPDAKRFCVPGDLLFALTLSKYGLQQNMSFKFEGMVGKDLLLNFPESIESEFLLKDSNEKHYLTVNREGSGINNLEQIEAFIRAYVAFSGHNFADILLPLMKKHEVMINPARPLIIYEQMSFELESMDFSSAQLKFEDCTLDIEGKRGDAKLTFTIYDGDTLIGQGNKTLILSGLRPYSAEELQPLLDSYNASKDSYKLAC